jgi:two-component sensor histidine kinase
LQKAKHTGMKAPIHPHESDRLRALRAYGILDTPREADFDDIVALAARLCDAPISVVNLIDETRQWFKAEVGLGVSETPLDSSLCAHAILEDEFVEIPDTLADGRLCDNPLCLSDGGIRFYAGAQLRTGEGLPLGTLCVLDTRPRRLDPLQREVLRVLSAQVMTQLDLRRALQRKEALRKESDHRVKNSMMMVASLVRMQARVAPDPATRAALMQAVQRIDSVAALHGMIYRADEDNRVDLADYLTQVAGLLTEAKPNRVALDLDLDPVFVAATTATAAAIVVNELCTNAFKHAYPEGQAGTITITGRRAAQNYVLSIRDDGVGFDPHTPASAGRGGIGRSIIEASVQQVGGRLMQHVGGVGHRVELTLPL